MKDLTDPTVLNVLGEKDTRDWMLGLVALILLAGRPSVATSMPDSKMVRSAFISAHTFLQMWEASVKE